MTPKMPTLFDQYKGKLVEVNYSVGDSAVTGKGLGVLERELELEMPYSTAPDADKSIEMFWILNCADPDLVPLVGSSTAEVAVRAKDIVFVKHVDKQALMVALDKAKQERAEMEQRQGSGIVGVHGHLSNPGQA